MNSVRNPAVVLFILVIWFAISFVTNIIGPLMPVVIDDFGLTLTMAALLPFPFFLAYGIASIPAGVMIETIGMKRSMLIAFAVVLCGTMAFSLFPTYRVVIGSLFVIGIGMAMLQVIINPLMRTSGGEEHFAFFSVLGQLVFGFASFVSPFVFTYLVTRLPDPGRSNLLLDTLRALAPADLSWVALYWLFGAAFAVLLAAVWLIRLPDVKLQRHERTASLDAYRELLGNPHARMFFFGIVCYVGTEQGVANWMSEFLQTYHGVDPQTLGRRVGGQILGPDVHWLRGWPRPAQNHGFAGTVAIGVRCSGRFRARGAVRPGDGFSRGLPMDRILHFGDVFHRVFIGTQFRGSSPWRLFGHSLHGDFRRRAGAAADRRGR